MIKLFLFFILLFSISRVEAQYKLEIEITNLKSNEGFVALQLFDNSQKIIFGKMGSIHNYKSLFVIENLKAGKYAVRFFHDENANKKLDLNFMGIPKEGYGISNNAYGLFGPKSFEDWLFDVLGNKKIILKTKN